MDKRGNKTRSSFVSTVNTVNIHHPSAKLQLQLSHIRHLPYDSSSIKYFICVIHVRNLRR